MTIKVIPLYVGQETDIDGWHPLFAVTPTDVSKSVLLVCEKQVEL